MKRFWRRKCFMAAATVAVFLSVGAVAWAATGNDPAGETSVPVVAAGEAMGAAVTAVADDGTATTAAGAVVRNAAQQKKQQWLKRQAALLQSLRDDMTPTDQAAYDQLVAKAKEQREALKQARQNLKETLKQLRDLADKYLDTTASTTG